MRRFSINEIYLPESVSSLDGSFIDPAILSKVTIFCPEGSYAETFANTYGIKCKLIVPATSVTLSENRLSLEKGKTADLAVTIDPAEAMQKVEWVSSNDAVATVNNGKVKAVAPGTRKIYCMSQDSSGLRAICEVTVE